jgi:hypothetical protein
MRATLLLIVLTAAEFSGQSTPRQHRLDLATASLSVIRDPTTVRGPCFAGHSGYKSELPVRVTFEGVTPGEYRVGEPFAYELMVENIGSAAIVLPWLPQDSLLDRPVEQLVMARIALEATDAAGKTLNFAPGHLEGSPEVPNSTITLQPRDRATIRIEGRMQTTLEPTGELTPTEYPLRLHAVLRATTKPCYWSEPAASINSVVVHLRRPA